MRDIPLSLEPTVRVDGGRRVLTSGGVLKGAAPFGHSFSGAAPMTVA